VPPGRVHRVEAPYLKAAVSLGARLYALGLCGEFMPAEQGLRDRIVLVCTRAGGTVAAIELLPPGASFRGGEITGAWIDVPAWEQARLVKTWKLPVERPAVHPWELDPREQVAMLHGESADATTGTPSHVTIPFDSDRVRVEAGAAGCARLRVVVDPWHGVTIESQRP
jgi:hypothetical protein